MKWRRTAIADVICVEPTPFPDTRGHFTVMHNAEAFARIVGRPVSFVQDNMSGSHRNVLRGLHYQLVNPQDKLVWVTSGAVFDVAVDLRRNSPTFGTWAGEILSRDNGRQLWIPKGCAHGFVALSDFADLFYKVTESWNPASERCIAWDDPDLAIDWPITSPPILADKDRAAARFKDADHFDM